MMKKIFFGLMLVVGSAGAYFSVDSFLQKDSQRNKIEAFLARQGYQDTLLVRIQGTGKNLKAWVQAAKDFEPPRLFIVEAISDLDLRIDLLEPKK